MTPPPVPLPAMGLAPDNLSSQYHPDFSAVPALGPDFAVTLVSTDKVHFRISANVLKHASGLFAQILSLPQPSGSQDTAVIDNLDEDSRTIEGLLRMITGEEIPSSYLDTLDAIEPLLLAAVKWEMRGPSSILHFLLLNVSTFVDNPIRLYWLGCHLGWADVTAFASKHSAYSDLYRKDLRPWLLRLDSRDLLRLMSFHRLRLDSIRTFLERDVDITIRCCLHHGLTHLPRNSAEYCHFKWMILDEINRVIPSRHLSKEKIEEFMAKSQIATLPVKCNICEDDRSPFSVSAGIQSILRHWATLPQTV